MILPFEKMTQFSDERLSSRLPAGTASHDGQALFHPFKDRAVAAPWITISSHINSASCFTDRAKDKMAVYIYHTLVAGF